MLVGMRTKITSALYALLSLASPFLESRGMDPELITQLQGVLVGLILWFLRDGLNRVGLKG